MYENVREKKQWTLDRIDNDIGHTSDNVVICCLECNLKRGRLDDKKFKFTKQMKIIKNISKIYMAEAKVPNKLKKRTWQQDSFIQALSSKKSQMENDDDDDDYDLKAFVQNTSRNKTKKRTNTKQNNTRRRKESARKNLQFIRSMRKIENFAILAQIQTNGGDIIGKKDNITQEQLNKIFKNDI